VPVHGRFAMLSSHDEISWRPERSSEAGEEDAHAVQIQGNKIKKIK
jgi:hypothetical protein